MPHLPPFRTGHTRREQGTCMPVPGLDLPFTVLEGAAPGPVLLVTAGVHGAEFCSIEAALRLTRLDPAALRGTLIVLPILNPGAFRARAPFVMRQDGKNLNRMFPGRPDGTASERLAHWLVTAVTPCPTPPSTSTAATSSRANTFSLTPRVSVAAKGVLGHSVQPHAEEPAQRASRSTQGPEVAREI